MLLPSVALVIYISTAECYPGLNIEYKAQGIRRCVGTGKEDLRVNHVQRVSEYRTKFFALSFDNLSLVVCLDVSSTQ